MMEMLKELTKRINDLNYHYYTLDEPLVSDGEYDELYDKLIQLEKELGYREPDSPSQRVGAAVLPGFVKHNHIMPLWSLDKAQSIPEVKNWVQRVNRAIEEYNSDSVEVLPNPEYIIEYKFDGLTINLTYENGLLIMAATRGNGITGEEILPQIRTIKSIPLSIDHKGLIEIQGEGVMPLKALEKYNETAEIPLKNARNAAAGALRNLDPEVTKSRQLDAYFYNIGYVEDRVFETDWQMLEFLETQGLKVNGYRALVREVEGLEREIQFVEKSRHDLGILTDGVVIKLNDIRSRDVLGYTAKFPRWAIAYKFEAEEYTTVLREVIWNVGRTGKVTPSALLDPVDIGGVTVQRATLNNYDDILRKQLRLGAEVLIRRSNDVIPEILGAISATEEGTFEIQRPTHCPSCHSELVQNGVHIFCPNSISCTPQLVARLVHFASRDAMDIENLSEKTIEKLMSELGITRLSDIYELKREELLKLEGFKEKRTDKLLNAIEKSKHVELSAFIYALGIPNVGIKTAQDLERAFGSLDAIRRAEEEELLGIPDVGLIIAQSIEEFFHDEEIISGLDDLLNHGIEPIVKSGPKDSPVAGMRFVVTGSFETYSRKDIESILTYCGANVSSSVSKKTSMVLVGADPGSKYEKAKSLGVKILEGEDVEKFIKSLQ